MYDGVNGFAIVNVANGFNVRVPRVAVRVPFCAETPPYRTNPALLPTDTFGEFKNNDVLFVCESKYEFIIAPAAEVML